MRHSYGLDGGSNGVVEQALGNGGAAWLLGDARLFCGEGERERWRVRERARVSRMDSVGSQVSSANALRRGPDAG